MTREQWKQLEQQAFKQEAEYDDYGKQVGGIGHPVELARAVVPIALKKYSKKEIYNAAKEFADEETFPHIAYRLSR